MLIRLLVLNCYLAVFLVIAPCSYALEYTVQPRLMFGWMSYSFKDNVSPFTSDSSIDYNGVKPYGGFGTTLTHKNYYVDIYWQQELNSYSQLNSSTTNDMVTLNDTTIFNYSLEKNLDAKFGRKDFVLTFGTTLDKMTFFGGYKITTSYFDMGDSYEIEERFRENELIPYYTNKIHLTTNNMDYENRSLFLGCGYRIVYKIGMLAGKIAINYSRMEAIRNYSVGVHQLDEDISNVDDEADRIFTRNRKKSKEKKIGVSLGISWKGPISKYWNYVFSFDAGQYKFDEIDELSYKINASIVWIIPFEASLNY